MKILLSYNKALIEKKVEAVQQGNLKILHFFFMSKWEIFKREIWLHLWRCLLDGIFQVLYNW